MLDVGPNERPGSADALAGSLIDGLAAHAEQHGPAAVTAAVRQIRRRAEQRQTPVAMYRLAEALTPGPMPPPPRQPLGDLAAAVDCVRRYATVVLDAADPAATARMLAALVGDGMRLLVTGPDDDELAAVRAALPPTVAGLCLDGPEPLSFSELRELRALLATSTPQKAARCRQLLPTWEQVPDPELVATLCAAAGKPGAAPQNAAELIPELLGQLPERRLTALVSTARRCDVAVSALNHDGQAPWSWELLESLLFGQSRLLFERLMTHCEETLAQADKLRDAGDQLAVVGTIAEEDLAALRRYADYLDAGGRSRGYFRSPEQRAVQPVLRQLRLEGVPLKDSTLLRQALDFVALIEAVELIGDECHRLGLPVPSDIPAVQRLLQRLRVVDEAARSVETLRHDVLFIHPNSPVSMPDMATTEAVARAIIDSGGAARMAEARERLAELAARFVDTLPERYRGEELDADPRAAFTAPTRQVDMFAQADPEPEPTEPRPAPEYLEAVRALRDHKLQEYLEALHALAAARRERDEQNRLTELLDRLRAAAPGLAEAWQRTGGRTFAPGTVRFQPVDQLLGALPGPDTADVLLLLGADRLGAGHLAVAASAPRLMVASAGGPLPTPATPPPTELRARLAAGGETVAGLLRRSAVPVVAPVAPPAPSPGVPQQQGAPAPGTPAPGSPAPGSSAPGSPPAPSSGGSATGGGPAKEPAA